MSAAVRGGARCAPPGSASGIVMENRKQSNEHQRDLPNCPQEVTRNTYFRKAECDCNIQTVSIERVQLHKVRTLKLFFSSLLLPC